MVLAVTINVLLATIVFAAVIALIMRAIRTQDTAAPAITVQATRPARAQHAHGRSRAGSLVQARPWA
jgi:hypothetical protein